ncbi:MAG: DUF2513 domain-containing protein [Bellilinea sp.]
MKRDLDLIRLILLKVESNEELIPTLEAKDFSFDEYSHDQVKYNIKLLIDADYINGKTRAYLGGNMDFVFEGLTWAGHDFLDASRDDARWAKAKSILNEVKDYSLELAIKVLSELAIVAARQAMGL